MRQVKRYLWVAAALLGGFSAAGQAHRLTVTDAAYQAFADPNSPNGVRFLSPKVFKTFNGWRVRIILLQ